MNSFKINGTGFIIVPKNNIYIKNHSPNNPVVLNKYDNLEFKITYSYVSVICLTCKYIIYGCIQ